MDLRSRADSVSKQLLALGIPLEQQKPEELRRLVPPEFRSSVSDAEPELISELVVHWARSGLITVPTEHAALAIERLSVGTHSCHVYREPSDLLEIALPWLRAGIRARQACLWIVPEAIGVDEALALLAVALPDLSERRAAGQITVVSSRDWYLDVDGRAKSEETLGAAWTQAIERAKASGFDGLRAVGDMSWIAGRPDLERFIDYEKRCNELAPQMPLAGLCTYQLGSLPGDALSRVAEAHQRSFVKSDGIWHRLEGGSAAEGLKALRQGDILRGGARFARPSFAGRAFPPNRHVCGFFRGPNERDSALMPFIKEGFERGEKAIHVVKRDDHVDHLERLSAAGIDVERALSSGQLEVLDWEKTYLQGGRFEPAKMPALIEGMIADSRAAGYPLMRYVGNMEWSLEDCPGVEKVLEYESKLHPLLLKYPDPVLCCYDVGRYTAEFVVEMLRVHQIAIVCGILNENSFFVPPDRYLAERAASPIRAAV